MKKLFVLYVSMFSMLISPLSYGEYSLTPVFKGKNTSGHYYEKNGMPHLFLDRKCKTVKKKQRCVDSLKNGEGDVFIKHSTDTHSITLRYLTRYQSKAFAWVTVSKHKEKGITSKFVIDSDNKRYSSNGPARNAYAVSITSDGVIVSVNEQGIYGVGGFLAAPEPLDKGEISINIGGEMAAVGIGASGSVLVSDTKQWSDTNVQLSERGDRVGVVAIFPDDRGENIYGAVYKYINLYNKGLVAFKTTVADQQTKHGWLFNSETRNIGFSPQIYSEDDYVVISARNSSVGEDVHFKIEKTKFDSLSDFTPDHALGFENESYMEFLAGVGVSYLFWEAKSSIPENDTITMDVDYSLDSTLYRSLFFQGRYGDTQLAVSYLENQFRTLGETQKNVSKALNFFVDINDLISKQSTLRLKSETSRIYGTANLRGEDSSDISFVTDYQAFSGLLMFERGLYGGIEYADYEMPSALGFSDHNGVVTHAKYDPSVGLHRLSFVGGYDEKSYAGRYEGNYSTFYASGEVSVGFAYIDISREIKEEVESGGKEIKSSTAMVFGAKVDLGYMTQRRLKVLWGAGFSFFTGYRISGVSFNSGQGDEVEASSKIEEDELALEFKRYDIWHGPFLNVNLVF